MFLICKQHRLNKRNYYFWVIEILLYCVFCFSTCKKYVKDETTMNSKNKRENIDTISFVCVIPK